MESTHVLLPASCRRDEVGPLELKSYWKQLERSVTSAIDAGDIGVPRALRVTLHADASEWDTESTFALILESANSWFGGQPEPAEPATGKDTVHVAMLRWRSGATALLSGSTSTGAEPSGDLTLLGSRGSVYHRISGVDDL